MESFDHLRILEWGKADGLVGLESADAGGDDVVGVHTRRAMPIVRYANRYLF